MEVFDEVFNGNFGDVFQIYQSTDGFKNGGVVLLACESHCDGTDIVSIQFYFRDVGPGQRARNRPGLDGSLVTSPHHLLQCFRIPITFYKSYCFVKFGLQSPYIGIVWNVGMFVKLSSRFVSFSLLSVPIYRKPEYIMNHQLQCLVR